MKTVSNPKSVITKLPIMEAFETLQGEGFHTGTAAYFIRTGGCDVGCVWCDVKESWDAGAHPETSIDDLVKGIDASSARVVVVTGGEPLMYDMDILTSAIHSTGKMAHIETSGAYDLSGEWDWICFSPKKFKAPKEVFFEVADELKVVVFHSSDLEWAAQLAEKMNPNAKLYLQPEWSRKEKVMPMIVDYIRKNPAWRISLQTHKYMDIP